jgi:RNA polymerase sigma-70 factor (ECF subfamily)
MTDSPVVRLNHAVAIAMADSPQAGLAALELVEGLDNYHLFHAARGELLTRAERPDEAIEAFNAAIALTYQRRRTPPSHSTVRRRRGA